LSQGFTGTQKNRCSSQPISWLSTEKKLNQTQQKQTCIRNKTYYNMKLTHTKTKAGLVASYNLWMGNGTGRFWMVGLFEFNGTFNTI